MKSEPLNPSTSQTLLQNIYILVPGLSLVIGLAILATSLSQFHGLEFLSPLILVVLLGAFVRNVIGISTICQPGIKFSMKRILRLAVILLGLRLNTTQVFDLGWQGLVTIIMTLSSTFIFTCWLGRQWGIDRKLVQLIAAGTSICGASAVVASNSVVKSSDEDVAYAVAIVTIFGTLSMLLYPSLDSILQLDPTSFGLWCGASIHEVAQVVAAAFQMGQPSGEAATIAKLSRVVFLVPTLLGLGVLTGTRRQSSSTHQGLPIPWFVLGFLLLMLCNSIGVFPVQLTETITQWNKFLLTIALAGMGLETSFSRLKTTGLKPFYLGAVAWIFISSFSFGLVSLFY